MFAFSSCFAMILMYIVSGELLNFDGTAKFTSKKMHLIIEITHIFYQFLYLTTSIFFGIFLKEEKKELSQESEMHDG
jgi:preprotein translocase subunit SecG